MNCYAHAAGYVGQSRYNGHTSSRGRRISFIPPRALARHGDPLCVKRVLHRPCVGAQRAVVGRFSFFFYFFLYSVSCLFFFFLFFFSYCSSCNRVRIHIRVLISCTSRPTRMHAPTRHNSIARNTSRRYLFSFLRASGTPSLHPNWFPYLEIDIGIGSRHSR